MTEVTQYAIALKYAAPGLPEKLEDGMLFLRNAGCELSFQEKAIDRWTHIFCTLDEKEDTGADTGGLFGRMLAENLTDVLMESQADFYLEELLCQYYFYFPRPERRQILDLAGTYYRREREKEGCGQIYHDVMYELKCYLDSNRYLNLHGLVIFRLRNWLEFLRRQVDRAVEDYLLEKEYQEFIKLLKYFVALQEPKIHQIHVTLDKDGDILLLDQSMQPVERGQQSIQWDGYESITDGEDHLVSLLITAAPHRVILHKQVYTLYPKAVDTLKHVFENRVTLCKRCKLCPEDSKHLTLKGK
jgi:putative sporulation protein YtxC